VGLKRRAGVCAPLFSLHSKESVGIGEIPDLIPFIDWAASTGLSIIQLLPLNDVGFDFAPYSAKSSFASIPCIFPSENGRGGHRTF
jgi:4-alpha-glucanotransferase